MTKEQQEAYVAAYYEALGEMQFERQQAYAARDTKRLELYDNFWHESHNNRTSVKYQNRRPTWMGKRASCQGTQPYSAAKRKAYAIRSKYGLSLHDYNTMLSAQDGKCAICGSDGASLKDGLCVDHCHTSGKVRGLLCAPCNKGLGFFNDTILRLLNAAEYLSSFKTEE